MQLVPPAYGSFISPWTLAEDVEQERQSTEQKHIRKRDGKVDLALRAIGSGEDVLNLRSRLPRTMFFF